jgi:hypothetical protein
LPWKGSPSLPTWPTPWPPRFAITTLRCCTVRELYDHQDRWYA